MPDILLVSDSEAVRDEVKAAVGDSSTTFRELTRGAAVRHAVEEKTPDLAIIDLQVGKMGGMASCLDLRLEESAGRLPHVPVLMLLDRRADVFLARRSQAEGWIVKPLDPMRLGRAVRTVLAGSTYEDGAYKPVTVVPRGAAIPFEHGAGSGPLQ
ncbi:MAG TPA: response regulator [Acidimicrobiales bacterium]|nr:response regulator [Acidimicrobiales bacterium]